MFDASVLGDNWYNMVYFVDQTDAVKIKIKSIDECFKKLCYTDTNVETLGYVGLPAESQSFAQQLQTETWYDSELINYIRMEIGLIRGVIVDILDWVQDKDPLLKDKVQNNCELLRDTLNAYTNQIIEQIDNLTDTADGTADGPFALRF